MHKNTHSSLDNRLDNMINLFSTSYSLHKFKELTHRASQHFSNAVYMLLLKYINIYIYIYITNHSVCVLHVLNIIETINHSIITYAICYSNITDYLPLFNMHNKPYTYQLDLFTVSQEYTLQCCYSVKHCYYKKPR